MSSKITLSKKITFTLFLLLFIYSGIEALTMEKRTKKIRTLVKKINVSQEISRFLIIGASILEFLCPLVIIIAMFLTDNYHKSKLVQYCFYFLMLFMLVVSLIYYYNQPIRFLTNLSLLTALIYTYLDIYH